MVITRNDARQVTVRAAVTEPLGIDGKLDEAVYRATPPMDRLHPDGAAER